ncbi:MAG TPA: DUF2089 family protein [Armatimonadaceae bacterium]|nr:DUF2089 family protein [Armatimonadaceae bacterium]
MPRQVTICPVCDGPLRVTELSCSRCETRLHGVFPGAPLARLGQEHQRFIEAFVLCRGVIRDMERVLGVSYPTVRSRLDGVVEALEAALAEERATEEASAAAAARVASGGAREEKRKRLLRAVEDGEMDPLEAAEQLRRL